MDLDLTQLRILHYPDRRLRVQAVSVADVDGRLQPLIDKMFDLMRAARGVGLAAPQVGVGLRLFVMNATGEPHDDRVIINPLLTPAGTPAEAEEGCLSLPGINVMVRRPVRCRLEAVDAQGRSFVDEADGLVARIWQHETDHLNGTLIIDKMGPTDRIATRKTLRALEDAASG